MKKNKFLHTFESIYLCLRFPFLYPRNRFTGKHNPNVLRGLIWKLKEESTQPVSVTAKQETKDFDKYFPRHHSFLGYHSELKKEDKKVIILKYSNKSIKEVDLTKLLWDEDKFEILGSTLIFTFSGTPTIQVNVRTKDENDKNNYGFHFETVEFITNKWKYFLYKVVSWFDEQILDRILFIPTYTELDAMEPGWRKAFGIQMCKELKAQLKKDHYLYKYRITQIKEKFGYLHWYDEGSSREVQDIISKYEDISWNTCLVCGKPATKITSRWISPYCDDCFPNNEIVYQHKINGKWEQTNEYQKLIESLK